MAWSHGKHWSSELIREALRPIVVRLGRMPSANELRVMGLNDLACAIPRRGGFRSWAATMGVQLKGTETHRGFLAEDEAAQMLTDLGICVVRQTARCEFDLLANGRQVDVKSARPGIYGRVPREYKGWMFHLRKVPATCEFYMLMCLSESGETDRVYLVPAEKAGTRMLTITPNGKYEKYRAAFNLLL